MSTHRFASALSTSTSPESAAAEAVEELTAGLAGRTPDLVVAYATPHYGSAVRELGPYLQRSTGAGTVMGCCAQAVVGGSRELEGKAGVSVWAASLADTAVRPFTARARPTGQGEVEISGLPEVETAERAGVVLLVDPFSFPADAYLRALGERMPGLGVIGGMASAGLSPGQALLFDGDGPSEGGALGVVVEGAVEVATVVSQGCRPVGKPWVITACEQNVVRKLGGRPPVEVLAETLEALPPHEAELLRRGPFLGLAIDPTKSVFERGDFLVRALQPRGNDGSLAVGDLVRRGQTVQFLVRDASTAGEDLRQLVAGQGGGPLPEGSDPAGVGALLFTCNGRGRRMFDVDHHDATCVRESLGSDVPLAGFFAAGEIGPVGGRNFLHGFTASVAVFRPRPQ